MATTPPALPGSSTPALTIRLGQAFRRYFVTGLATLFPVWVTVLLLVELFRFMDGRLGRLLGVQVPGLGLLGTIGIILVVGVLSVHLFGRVVFSTLEVAFGRLPVIRKV